MLNLLVFFALPLATILLSIVLQKILKCPILVAITFFAIYLIVAFAAFSDNLAEAIIATIIYSILAFITASIVRLIDALRDRLNRNSCCRNCCCCNNDNNNTNTNNGNLLRISCSCGNGESNDLLTVNSSCGNNNEDTDSDNDDTTGCCRCSDNTANQGVSVNASVVPCSNNGGRTGCIRGCYRRM